MTEKEKASAESRRVWFSVLCIVPFGLLMFVGTLELFQVVPLLIKIDHYEKRIMLVDSVKTEFSGRSGRAMSYVGYGYIARQRLSLNLGSVDNEKIKAFVEKVEKNDTASIGVFYYPPGNSAFRSKHLSISQFRSDTISNFTKAIFFVLPFLICLSVALFYHVKLMKDLNTKRKL